MLRIEAHQGLPFGSWNPFGSALVSNLGRPGLRFRLSFGALWVPGALRSEIAGDIMWCSGVVRTDSGAPYGALGGAPRHPGHPLGQKKIRSLPCFTRGSLARALTPRIGLPERIPAHSYGIQLQGRFSHPWGTPGRGYDPHRGHLGLAEAPNLHTDAHRCTFRWDGV